MHFNFALKIQPHQLSKKSRLSNVLATAAGPEGMVGGQAFDLLSEGKHIPLEELKVFT